MSTFSLLWPIFDSCDVFQPNEMSKAEHHRELKQMEKSGRCGLPDVLHLHEMVVEGRSGCGQVGVWRMTLSGGPAWGHQPSSDGIRGHLAKTGPAFRSPHGGGVAGRQSTSEPRNVRNTVTEHE